MRLAVAQRCTACGSVETRSSFVRTFAMVSCATCGLRWLLDPPTGSELALLYQTGFYAGPGRGGPLVTALHSVNNAIRLRALDGLQPGRLLDVGSGKGRFLAAARDAGWEVLGVESAEGAAASAQDAFGVEVVVDDFLAASLAGSFDVVTMWHTLEHLPDPGGAIKRAWSLLGPGGRLIVSVPNSSSLQARLGGDQWFHLDLPRHLYHFGPHSLTSLVEGAGFRVERLGHFYPEMEVIGLVQTALNRAGLGQDVLYRFAKRDETAGRGMRLAVSAVLALALTPAALNWALLAPLFRTGASIQLVATRRD